VDATVAIGVAAAIALVIAVAVVVAFFVSVRVGANRRYRAEGPGFGSVPAHVEQRRQAAVDALAIVDTAAEDRFDRIVSMARQLYGTETAVFSIIDHGREWHKAISGPADEQVDRGTSFCSVTIRGNGPLVVPDAQADARFSDVQAVVDEPHIRFYAGFPVKDRRGQRVGALCVYDSEPRDETDIDPSMLAQLAHLIEAELRAQRVL
jgi:GAF domain-containing protein